MSRAGDVLNGKYEVERQLAKGGMGSVWIARDLKLGRRVAVKFIEVVPNGAADAAAIRARFEREAMAVARLRTPHVVQIFDHALEGQTPYIVMECLEGEDLRQRLAREKRLSFAATVAIMNQAARGLRAAHEAGIVHRDLKPANVFLAEIDREEVVKILDFGIAKLLDHRGVTVDGEIFGSARYMSPEQITGAKDLDLRSDLWSMGVILYRAITGQDPFSGDIVKTVQSLRLGDYPKASSVAPDLGPEVDAFFARALALDKRRRFLSAVEMAEAFADLGAKRADTGPLAGLADATERPVTAPPDPPEATARIVGPGSTDRLAPLPLPIPETPLPTSRDPETMSTTARDPRPSSRFRAASVAILLLALVATTLALRTRSATTAIATPTAAPPAPAAVLLADPVPSAPPPSIEAPPTSDDGPPAASEEEPAPSASASAAPPVRRATKPNCDPPFIVDAHGTRIPIKACFR